MFRQDIRHGLRSLMKTPMITFLASAALAVGIAATTTMVSVVHAVLLSPLPFNEPEQLVRVVATNPTEGIEEAGLSSADLFDFQEELQSLSFLGAYQWFGLALTEQDRPRELSTILVTPGLLSQLAQPLHGRTFLPEEAEPGKDRVVVLGFGFWQSELGSDPAVVGETISLDHETYRIVGIMPASFAFPRPGVSLWIPRVAQASELDRKQRFWPVVGRLADGIGLRAAQAEADTIARALESAFPDTNEGWQVRLVPLRDHVVSGVRPALLALLAAVVVVLLIACANVANLLVTKGLGRQKEVATKAALGASRSRLVRGLLVESAILATLGGVSGIWVAWLGVRSVVQLAPEGLPRLEEVALDLPVLGYAVAVTFATGVLFGLVPALRLSRFDLAGALSSSSRSVRGASGHGRLRRLISVSQLSLSVVLLVGAALLLRSFVGLLEVDSGFRTDKRIAVQLFVYGEAYPSPSSQRQFFRELFEELRGLPGVRSVAGIDVLPLTPLGGATSTVHVVGRAEPSPMLASVRPVTSGLFHTIGARILAGRDVAATDHSDAPRVAVINRTGAEQFFPGESALGKQLLLADGAPVEVVGIVDDIRLKDLTRPPAPEIFVAFDQSVSGTLCVVVETASDPEALLGVVQESVWRVDPAQPIWRAATFDTLVAETTAQTGFYSTLVTLFAAVAMTLAALGLYGVMSFSVMERQREIGIRMAMGASTAAILRMVLRDGTTLVVAGLGLGISGSLVLSHVLGPAAEPLLFEASVDAHLLGLVAVVLTLVGAAANFFPARRAARLAPVVALRDD